MSELPPPHSPEPGRTNPLDYATPEIFRPANGVEFGGQVVLGCVAFVAAILAGVVMAAMIGAVTRWSNAMFLFGPAIAVSGLVLLAVTAHRRWRWRGFLLGLLIGLGLAGLGAGLCFVIALR